MQKPKIIEITRLDGTIGKFEIRQWSAMDGMRFVTQYPSTLTLSATKVGNYVISEKLLIEMFAYVSVILGDDVKIELTTRDLIDNHVGDFMTLQALIREMFDFNTHFFTNGNHWSFLTSVIKGIADSLIEISQTSSDNS